MKSTLICDNSSFSPLFPSLFHFYLNSFIYPAFFPRDPYDKGCIKGHGNVGYFGSLERPQRSPERGVGGRRPGDRAASYSGAVGATAASVRRPSRPGRLASAGRASWPGPARPASGGVSSVRPSWAGSRNNALAPWAPSSSASVVGLSRRRFVRSSSPGACLRASWLAGYGGGVGLLQPNPCLASHALDARALATGPVDEHGTRSVCSSTRSSSQRE